MSVRGRGKSDRSSLGILGFVLVIQRYDLNFFFYKYAYPLSLKQYAFNYHVQAYDCLITRFGRSCEGSENHAFRRC